MRRLIYFFMVLLILTAVVSCSLKMPGMPVWSIQVDVPFSRRTYRLAELVTDSTKMAQDGYGILYGSDDSILKFEYRDTLDFKPIGERMNYNASDTSTFRNLIGLIVIEASAPDTSSITIVEALSDDVVDSQGTIDPFDLPVKTDTLSFANFEWIKVRQGLMNIEFSNGFPFPLENITLTFDNLIEGSRIGSISFAGPIARDSALTDSLPLGRDLLHNEIGLTLEGYALGSPDRRIRIRGDEAVTVVASIGETSADSAYAEIQAQNSIKSDTLHYDDPNRVQEAIIASGWAYIRISNITPARLISSTRFHNIFTPDGDELVQVITIDPGTMTNPTTRLDSIDLHDYSVRMSVDEQQVPILSEFETEDTRVTMYRGTSIQKITKY